MEIIKDDYQVCYDSQKNIVICSGSFRLTGTEYNAIQEILYAAADAGQHGLTVDLTGLKFLNSSGINMLSKFVIRLRKSKTTQVKVKGNNQFAWQKKSLVNFKKLLPDLELEFE